MPHQRLDEILKRQIDESEKAGTLKGAETVISTVLPPLDGFGPRYRLRDSGEKPFLRMNSNSYLGLSYHPEVIAAGARAADHMGAGPGAVRFISGTWTPHVELEDRLAAFHARQAAMIFSSAYSAVMGVLPQIIDDNTVVISDELNHNSIINAIRLARPAAREIYPHLDLGALERHIERAAGSYRRAVIITDGIFSMRGDCAPLDQIMRLAADYDARFPENIVVVVDDSHGVGAFGTSGRGSEEHTQSEPVDVLIGTLGKAFGVNGGYVTGSSDLITYLRETSPFYIYSNPISCEEAAAASAAVAIVDSHEGRDLLHRLAETTRLFENGLAGLGLETIPSPHPVVPLLVRDSKRTAALVNHLYDNGILATGLNYPVVPAGEEEIRFQISADHTPGDIDFALDVVASFYRR